MDNREEGGKDETVRCFEIIRWWQNAQEALSRIFDRCEEIDQQSGYDMLEDIQFIRGFINKHKPQESEDKE